MASAAEEGFLFSGEHSHKLVETHVEGVVEKTGGWGCHWVLGAGGPAQRGVGTWELWFQRWGREPRGRSHPQAAEGGRGRGEGEERGPQTEPP